jgi:hypothetical protein
MATKVTQNAKVLHWLQKNGELTTREAVTELNIMSLPRRIKDLRGIGYKINMTYRKSQDGARYGVYTLVKEGKI